MLKVIFAEYLEEFKIKFELNEGSQGIIDFSSIINSDTRPILKELRDLSLFKLFTLSNGIVSWPNGFDLAPEYIFFLIHQSNPEYKTLFTKQGYLN